MTVVVLPSVAEVITGAFAAITKLLVITRFPVPLDATATKSPLPYVTPYQLLLAAEVLDVQLIPLVLVITPNELTATKRPFP